MARLPSSPSKCIVSTRHREVIDVGDRAHPSKRGPLVPNLPSQSQDLGNPLVYKIVGVYPLLLQPKSKRRPFS